MLTVKKYSVIYSKVTKSQGHIYNVELSNADTHSKNSVDLTDSADSTD